jgi:protein SCO1/2
MRIPMVGHQPSLAPSPEAGEPTRAPGRHPVRLRWWWLWAGALVVGVGAGAGIAVLHRSDGGVANSATAPVESWPAGVRRAPGFTLTDQNGRPVRLSSFRGRPVIVTFIDPLCRNFCPREASILSQAVSQLPGPRPAIVAVSVDPWGDTETAFREDAVRWQLSSAWRWGVGSYATLARVWSKYEIGVVDTKRTIDGITAHEITHTAAAYVIDPAGYERALLLYPFDAAEVVAAVRAGAAAPH